MRHPILTLVAVWLLICTGCSKEGVVPSAELKALEEAMRQAPHYELRSLHTLDSLKRIVARKNGEEAWRANLEISRTYRTLDADSSLRYAIEAKKYVAERGDSSLVLRTRLALVASMSTAGLFFAAQEELDSILRDMPSDRDLKIRVWKVARLFYSYSSAYTDGQPDYGAVFRDLNVAMDDSLIRYLDEKDAFSTFLRGERLVATGHPLEARHLLEGLMDDLEEDDNLYGMAAYQIAQSYRLSGDEKNYGVYLTRAATSDIKANIREGMALPDLAMHLYESGGGYDADTDRAFRYINFALSNSIEGKARMRTATLGNYIPLIDSAYAQRVKSSQRFLVWNISIATLLLIILGCLAYYLYREVRRRKANESELARITRLQEAYIGSFIALSANYAERMESFSRLVMRKLTAGRHADLLKMLEGGKYADENEDFYMIFDNAILDIYPDFIDEINSLLREEERITVKEKGRLNAEFRIYALVRLGIEESTRIAKILRYSVSTVYAYRNRMRNRAVERDTFEAEVRKKGGANPRP